MTHGGDLPLLELSGIRASYGGIEVLHGVDLELHEGTVMALLGPNGAGKSTTLKVCAGQVEPTGGDVYLAGRRINGAGVDRLARAGLCTVPEGRGVFPNLTVRENLWLATQVGVSRAEVEDITYARFPPLERRRSQLAGTLSGGEQQMLAMARALSTRPALLLLDELSMGLAPLVVAGLYESVAQVASEGVAILVVEQFARTVLDVANTAAILVNGVVTRVGSPRDLEADLSAAYLGE